MEYHSVTFIHKKIIIMIKCPDMYTGYKHKSQIIVSLLFFLFNNKLCVADNWLLCKCWSALPYVTTYLLNFLEILSPLAYSLHHALFISHLIGYWSLQKYLYQANVCINLWDNLSICNLYIVILSTLNILCDLYLFCTKHFYFSMTSSIHMKIKFF